MNGNVVNVVVIIESTQETYCRIDIKPPKGCKIQPVAFMGDPNSNEVKRLVSLYEKELEEFAKIYKLKRNRLKLVLENLCVE